MIVRKHRPALFWIAVLLLLLGAVAPIVPPRAEAGGIPLTLVNPSFEAPSSGGIPGWTQTFGTGGISLSTAQAYDGTQSLLLTDTSSAASTGEESAKVSGIAPGESYAASAKVYIASGSPSIYIRFFDSAGTLLSSGFRSVSSPSGQWTSVSVTAVAPANAAQASVLLYSSAAGTASAYFDSVVLERVIRNAGFEEGAAGTAIPGWTQTFGGSGVSVTTEQASEGVKSVKLVDGSTAGSVGVESDKIAVSVGQLVRASAKAYVAGGSVSLNIRFWDAGNTLLHMQTEPFGGSLSQWTPMYVSAVAPAGTAKMSILLYSTVGGTATAFFDDISLGGPVISNLGVQITNASASYAAFGPDSNGNHLLYIGSNGNPSKLAVYDAKTGASLHTFDLPGATAVWGMAVATDGSLYAGTASGKLFRYIPGSSSVADLGVAVAGETTIWELTPGTNGKIYGGTYPGGKAFKYEPGIGFTAFGGQIEPGEQYVRSIAYDESAHRLYMGIGSHAHLIRYDNNTGAKTNILPAAYATEEFTYYTNYAGGKIFAKMSPSGATLVIDKATLQVESTLSGIGSIGVSKLSPTANAVYYTKNGSLYTYDLTSKTETLLANVGSNMIGSAFIALNETGYPGYSFVAALRSGELLKYNPSTGNWAKTAVVLPESPTSIQSVKRGPDGNIYSVGYLVGGMGVYNPATGAQTKYRGVGQAEHITEAGSSLYFGIYPGAIIQQYDVTQPWNPTGTPRNPKTLFNLGSWEQDRPFGMLAVPSLNKLFVGTVPDYGKLGGAFAVYDLGTAALSVTRNVIPDQSVVSLAYKNNEVFGGTSVWGGLGIAPTAAEAKLFVWDATLNQKTFEIVPVAGKRAITALMAGPDGNIWGVAEGTLFVFNPATRSVVYSADKFPVSYSGANHVWRDAKMEPNPDGYVYATVGGKLYRIDPATKQTVTLVSGGASLLAQDNNGDLYYVSGVNLFKYDK
ncbi:carbohydrate binding domain-containing protein [Paenibacillus sp. GYB003]|uniref:carbohydrate binding domain-containing protein n=1 Tax=Paenibacillus sp. GYB003 TaxID=2994392 RepID=UPI002F96CCA5